MSKIKEILVEAMLPAIKAVGKSEMKAVPSGIKHHNSPEIYQTMLQGLYSNFSLLKREAFKTKTKVDDGVTDLILEAVEETAEAGRIVLS